MEGDGALKPGQILPIAAGTAGPLPLSCAARDAARGGRGARAPDPDNQDPA